MINAIDSLIGHKYQTPSGFLVEVVGKTTTTVVVRSFTTGHNVSLDLDYKLTPVLDTEIVKPEVKVEIVMEEKPMSEATTAPAPTAPKAGKLKKSNVVDDGLRTGLSADEIVKNVLTSFPETPEKSIRNLISVRRSKLKKTA